MDFSLISFLGKLASGHQRIYVEAGQFGVWYRWGSNSSWQFAYFPPRRGGGG